MHEFSLAQNLVSEVMREWEKIHPAPKRLVSIRVAIGALRQVVPEYLVFAYESLVSEMPIKDSRLEVRLCPWQVRCRGCGWTGERSLIQAQCPSCGGVELDTQGGEELHLENLEIEVADETGN
jgi:hydrogenase nickel incorporation protein HypA/HybF